MRSTLLIRGIAVLLGMATLMPWYSSQAQVEHDTYFGNPLPLIDWLLLAAAVATLVRPQLAVIAAGVGLVDVVLGALLMYGDAAEGLRVALLPGLPVTAAASVALLIFRPKADLPKEVAADRREDRPSSGFYRP